MRKFFKDILSEPNGKYSLTRVMAVVFSIAYLIGYFIILFEKKELADMPIGLGGLIAALYGINKFAVAYETKKSY